MVGFLCRLSYLSCVLPGNPSEQWVQKAEDVKNSRRSMCLLAKVVIQSHDPLEHSEWRRECPLGVEFTQRKEIPECGVSTSPGQFWAELGGFGCWRSGEEQQRWWCCPNPHL